MTLRLLLERPRRARVREEHGLSPAETAGEQLTQSLETLGSTWQARQLTRCRRAPLKRAPLDDLQKSHRVAIPACLLHNAAQLGPRKNGGL